MRDMVLQLEPEEYLRENMLTFDNLKLLKHSVIVAVVSALQVGGIKISKDSQFTYLSSTGSPPSSLGL